MKIKLKTEGYFDAAHQLKGYDGLCSNLHGHRWRVVVRVEGDSSQCDSVGILWDFKKIKHIVKDLDHKNLNEELDYNPTAENIAIEILKKLKNSNKNLKFKVRLYESPKSYVEVNNF